MSRRASRNSGHGDPAHAGSRAVLVEASPDDASTAFLVGQEACRVSSPERPVGGGGRTSSMATPHVPDVVGLPWTGSRPPSERFEVTQGGMR